MRTLRLVLWIAVALAVFLAGGLFVGSYLAGTQRQSLAAGAPLGGPFALIDQNGEPVTETLFRDKPSAVTFGFTHCPDVCPTTLFEMTQWAEALGAAADDMRFVFVTVDPERDTVNVLKNYIEAFSDRIVAVTGPPEAVEEMLSDYHIYSRKVALESGSYTMDHTASVFLLDEEGALAGSISPRESRENAVAKLRRLVAG